MRPNLCIKWLVEKRASFLFSTWEKWPQFMAILFFCLHILLYHLIGVLEKSLLLIVYTRLATRTHQLFFIYFLMSFIDLICSNIFFLKKSISYIFKMKNLFIGDLICIDQTPKREDEIVLRMICFSCFKFLSIYIYK